MADERPDPLTRVAQIITRATEELKSIEVTREIPLECDLGNLLVEDKNSLNEELLSDVNERKAYLTGLARDGVQALLTKVWDLPSHQDMNAIFVTLPKPTTRLPREKPIPKEKAQTRWEKYASEKGIQKKKKDKKVWDMELKRWVPRYGFQKVQADKEKNWVKEVPDTADMFEDQFAKDKEEKRERVAKNEFQRLRNIAKAQGVKVPKMGVSGNEFATGKELHTALHHAKNATASKGKFQRDLKGEKKLKGQGKKRRLEQTTGDLREEKRRYLDILDKVDQPNLNLDAAVNKQVKEDNVAMDLEKGMKKDKAGRRSKAGGRQRTKSDHRASKLGRGIHESKKQRKVKAKKAMIKSQQGMGKAKGKGKR